MTTIRVEVVKEYWLLKDYYQRKKAYAIKFMNYKFYLALSLLESKCLVNSFPELVYTDEAATMEVLDW